MLRAASESCATVSAAYTYKDNNTIPLSVDLVSLQLASPSPWGAIESALVRYWIQQKCLARCNNHHPLWFWRFFRKWATAATLFSLSLRQERMTLKLISALLQLVLLHAKRSCFMHFYCKRGLSKRRPVGKMLWSVLLVSLCWLGLTLLGRGRSTGVLNNALPTQLPCTVWAI